MVSHPVWLTGSAGPAWDRHQNAGGFWGSLL